MSCDLTMLACGGLVAITLASCVTGRQTGAPSGLESPGAATNKRGVGVTMEAPREVHEETSPGARCAIDAIKICRAYGATGPSTDDSRTVSIAIPDGQVVTVQCRYAGAGGVLISATPRAEATFGGNSEAFLSAHGFCAARPGG
jgi:hypothetical protein